MANLSTMVPDPGAREKFERLVGEWESATRFTSSVHQASMDRAYQQIIGMGPSALPLIFERLRKAPEHWFWALQAITGEDPVAPEHEGDIEKMRADWLRWARSHLLAG